MTGAEREEWYTMGVKTFRVTIAGSHSWALTARHVKSSRSFFEDIKVDNGEKGEQRCFGIEIKTERGLIQKAEKRSILHSRNSR